MAIVYQNDQTLQDTFSYHRDMRTYTIASWVWLAYDFTLTLGDEVEFVWGSANTLPKLLYFVSRYFGLFTQLIYATDLLPLYCEGQLIYRTIAYAAIHLSVELCLLLRVYAIWGQNKRVGYLLGTTWLLEVATNLVMVSVALVTIMRSVVPYPSDWLIRGCWVTITPPFFRACWLPVLLFETLLFVMSTTKLLSFRPCGDTPLIIRVFRDGTIYYALMCLILLIRTVSLYQPSWVSGNLVDAWMTAIFSISGSRLMLSIRALAAKRRRIDIQTPAISSTCRSCCDPMNPLTVPSFRTLPDDDIDIEMSDRPPFNISIPVPDGSNQSSENASEQYGSRQRSRDFDSPRMGGSERDVECEVSHALGEQSSCGKGEPCVSVGVFCTGGLDSSWENMQKSEVEKNPNLAALSDKNSMGSCRCRWGNVTWLQEWDAV